MERSFRHEIDRGFGRGFDAERHGDREELPVVGKRTLVQMLEAMAPVQPSRDAPDRAPGEVPHTARPSFTGPPPPRPRGDRIQAFFGRRDGAGAQGHGSAGADLGPQGAGEPLHETVRQKMERAFGQDFSGVRIHQGPRAAALGALAYTQGADIHFAPGQYQPESPAGQALLGHELAHVVQQRQGRVNATTQAKIAGAGVNDDPALEREADELGARAARGESVSGGPAGEGWQPAMLPVGSAPASAPLQCKLGVEIEVSDSAFELRRGGQAQDLSQSQTVATRAAGGKTAALKAEGPKERQALAEFVTDAYSYGERANLLAAIELIAAQATSISEGALGGWAIQGGDAVNILQWPAAPMGGFQVTISPVDNTVVHLYNAFPANKTTSYARGAGVTQELVRDEQDSQLEKTAAAIQSLRVLTARNADIAFWKWFSASGLATVKLPDQSPGELFNCFVSLSEAMSWRFGLLLKSWGTTFKNTLDVMPKFDFVALIDKQLKLFLGETDFEEKAAMVKEQIIAAFGDALRGQQDATMSAVGPSIEMALKFSQQELALYESQLESLLQEEQSGQQSLMSMISDKAALTQNVASKQREIGILKDLLSSGLRSTFEDITAVVSGKVPFLGDIRRDDRGSVMQDEGSLIAPDHNSPEGAFEHRNPFNSKVAAADWVDAMTQFLALLEQKGVRY